MKTTRKLLLGLTAAALLGGAGVAGATGEAKPEDPTKTQATTTTVDNLRTATITVKKVDKANHKVTFEAEVKPEASIMRNGQPIALDQLNEGDSVRASFDPVTGDLWKLEIVKVEPVQ